MYQRKSKKRTGWLFGALLCFACFFWTGCGETTDAASRFAAHRIGTTDLQYATQFTVDAYEDGYQIVTVQDGLQYLLLPPGEEQTPDWMTEEELDGLTVISRPVEQVYLAASSAMDLFAELDALDRVSMTSTKAADWGLSEIRDLVEADTIHYVGKYSAPDYEALLEEEIRLAVESTMIYHTPQVKEEIEALDIPVLVERSSYENNPLGRLEWIRLYGLLLGKEEEADRYFQSVCDRLEEVLAQTEAETEERPVVAFFSINANGAAVVRKPGDYVTQMIELAGGRYALADLQVEEENALSTMTLQMESFYENVVDADILIYNSAIEGDLTEISELLDLAGVLADCKAVKEGRVWCTNKNVYQKSAGVCDMILEMFAIFHGQQSEEADLYFHPVS